MMKIFIRQPLLSIKFVVFSEKLTAAHGAWLFYDRVCRG